MTENPHHTGPPASKPPMPALPPTGAARTPGQAAYEAYLGGNGAWHQEAEPYRAEWDDVAQAAIAAAQADGRTVPLAKFGEVVAELQTRRAERDDARAERAALQDELSAMQAERDQLSALLAEVEP